MESSRPFLAGINIPAPLIPFACSGHDRDVYCIDADTGEIHLLWVDAPDYSLPVYWQVAKPRRAACTSGQPQLRSHLADAPNVGQP